MRDGVARHGGHRGRGAFPVRARSPMGPCGGGGSVPIVSRTGGGRPRRMPVPAGPTGHRRVMPAASAQVELLSESDNEQTYKVDARILTPPEQMPQLQNELHRALQRGQSTLQNGRFEITKVEAVRDEHGGVTAYQVTLRKK